jgi:hypothetical protein
MKLLEASMHIHEHGSLAILIESALVLFLPSNCTHILHVQCRILIEPAGYLYSWKYEREILARFLIWRFGKFGLDRN